MTRVLVVDHEQQIRRALSVNLKARGYDVDLARIRRKLEADPSAPEHFVTEPGVGYRFVAGSPGS